MNNTLPELNELKISTQILLLSSQLSSTEEGKAGHLTNNHQQFLLLFDNVDLKDWSQAGDVSQRVLDNIQGVQTLFGAHQNYLQHSKKTQSLT